MEFITRIHQQLDRVMPGLNRSRQWTAVSVAVIALTVFIMAVVWMVQPEYRVLYAGLSPEDAGAITGKLQTLGKEYRLSANGTSVLVPADRVSQDMIDLAREGLPSSSGKGMERMMEPGFGLSPSQIHATYLLSQQEEIAKTLKGLAQVASARVHIVSPEKSPFSREQKPATASITLTLKSGATLNRKSVEGIVALVARAIEGLTPDNVTLLDNNGRLLSDSAGSNSGGAASTQLEFKNELENRLANKAEELLSRLLGPGRAIVRVTADVNFKHIREKKESFSPEEKYVKTEKTSNVKSTGPTPPGSRGAAGDANLRPAAGGATGGGESKNTEETSETTTEAPRTIRETEDNSHEVERLTVAAMVDLSGFDAGDSTAKIPSEKDIEEIIKQAVGYKETRDQVKVIPTKLMANASSAGADAELLQAQKWQNYVNVARNASLGVAALVALLLGIIYFRKLRGQLRGPEAPEAVEQRTRRVEAIHSAVEKDPEAIARLLSAWFDKQDEPPRKMAA